MLRALIVKELRVGIYGSKFVLSFVLALAAIPLALYVGAARYRADLEEFTRSTRDSYQAFRQQGRRPTHAAAHFGLGITKPPTPLSALSSGVQDVLGIRAELDPHRAPQLRGSTAERTPLLLLFGKLDYAFVIQVILGLFAFVLSFDLVSGEREDGTLKLVLAHAVPRSRLLLAKLAGGSLVIVVPVALATVVGLFFLTPAFGVSLTADEWWRAAAIVALSFVYLVMMFGMGLLASCLTRRRIASMIVLLIAWVVLIFVVPRSAVALAQRLQVIPSNEEVDSQLREIQRSETRHAEQRSRDFLAANPQLDRSSIPPTFFTTNRRAMDEAVERQAASIQQVVDAAKNRQVTLATALARLSPATAYLLAATDLAGTGVDRHRHFLRHLDDYRRRFAGHFDELELAGVTELEEYDDVPRFDYPEEGVGELVPRVVLDAGLMVGVSLVVFAAAYAAFLRYDVR
jgi:ABC-2 type transport system permease protein